MRRSARLPFSILVILAASLHGAAQAENWPNWRGPRQDGTSAEANVPLTWHWSPSGDDVESTNIRWRRELPDWGNSTPVIWNDSIFLTAHENDERLLVLRIDRLSGDLVWTREVGLASAPRSTPQPRGAQKFHREHNYATPSVATDGQVVVSHFGNGDTVVFDFDGNLLWRRNMVDEFGPFTIWWGHGNSPVLHDDLVILVNMQDSCNDLWETPSPSFLVAYDKRSGEQRWMTPRMTGARAEYADSYTTPLIWRHEGRTEMIVMGGEVLDAYDPTTGRRLWWLPRVEGNRVITGPTVADGVIYLTRGMRGPTMAVRPQGLGRQADEVVLWQNPRNTPDSSTPVVANGLVFTVSDTGTAKCMDATTGETLWETRLRGNFRASPLAADGRIYFLGMQGEATVVRAAPEYEVLAVNTIDDTTLATPVVAWGNLFLRGNKALYCIGDEPAPAE